MDKIHYSPQYYGTRSETEAYYEKQFRKIKYIISADMPDNPFYRVPTKHKKEERHTGRRLPNVSFKID